MTLREYGPIGRACTWSVPTKGPSLPAPAHADGLSGGYFVARFWFSKNDLEKKKETPAFLFSCCFFLNNTRLLFCPRLPLQVPARVCCVE